MKRFICLQALIFLSSNAVIPSAQYDQANGKLAVDAPDGLKSLTISSPNGTLLTVNIGCDTGVPVNIVLPLALFLALTNESVARGISLSELINEKLTPNKPAI